MFDGDGWVINGIKNFIINGLVVDVMILFVMNDRLFGICGICVFVIGMDVFGVTCGVKEYKLGIKVSLCSSVIFEDCCVSSDVLLGDVGKGFKVVLNMFNGGRIGIVVQVLGIV